MSDPFALVTIAIAGLAGISVIAGVTLAGWRGWLELQRQTIEARHHEPAPLPMAGSRIEIADLRERVRKLEAIAAGVDL